MRIAQEEEEDRQHLHQHQHQQHTALEVMLDQEVLFGIVTEEEEEEG